MSLDFLLDKNRKEPKIKPKLISEIIEEKSYERFIQMQVDDLEEHEFRTDVVHVTDLVYDCPRYVFLRKIIFWIQTLKGITKTRIGEQLHRIKILDEAEMEKEIEYENIRGRIDEYDADSGIVLEKKFTFTRVDKPYSHHIAQLQIYGWMAKKLGWNVRHLVLSYFSFDTIATGMPYISFEIPQANKLSFEEEILAKRDMLLGAFKIWMPPKRTMGWMCKNCHYAFLCFLKDNLLREVIRRLVEANIHELFFKGNKKETQE